MSDWFTEHNNWREKVAAMTAVNDLDIEKAVADQASGFVENKLGPLMKGDHPLGFEIVKKNDDNTRIVGVFAFKIDKSLLFAPVFFINGEIKGPLLYRCDTKTFVPANKEWAEYLISAQEMSEGKGRDRSRRFENPPLVQMQRVAFLPPSMMKRSAAEGGMEPAQKDVPVKELKVKATKITGKYTVKDMDDDDKQPETTVGELKVASYEDGSIRMRFNDEAEEFLTQDGAWDLQHKQAATVQVGGDAAVLDSVATEQIKQAFLENVEHADNSAVYDAMLKVADSIAEKPHLLKELLADPVYGEAATDVILKAADAHYGFTEQLARLCDGDATQLFSPKLEKKAAAEVPALALVYDQDCMSKEAAVSKEYFRDGFFIQDTRPEETLSVIYEDSPSAVSAPTEAGEYAILTNSGKLEKGWFVGRAYNGKLGEDAGENTSGSPCCVECSTAYIDDNPFAAKPSVPVYVVIKDKKVDYRKGLMGVLSKEAQQCDILNDTVREGKAYFMLTEGGSVLVGPIVIKKIKEVDGVKHCEAFYNGEFHPSFPDKSVWIHNNDIRPLTVNPDAETNLSTMVIGKDTKFIEVEMQCAYTDKSLSEALRSNNGMGVQPVSAGIDAGSTESVDKFIFNRWGIPKVKINKVIFEGEDTTPAFAIEAFGKSARMNKTCMMVKLARDLNIAAPKVYDIMEKVASNGSHEFYIEGLNKVAAQLHLAEQPQFDEKFDTEFGVPIEPTKVYHLKTQGIQLFEPPSSIGDAMNPTTSTGLPNLTVTTTAPEDLRALADAYSLPHVFDHAAVGTLADTFNAMSLMSKYIPAIEDAVDALGRIKFLFYWMPEDFEKAYGQDDLINLEAQIDTEFSALGSLLMKLLKKSEAMKKNDGNTDDQKKDKD